MISKQALIAISNELARSSGRRIPLSVIERDYVVHRIAAELARHQLHDALALRGGTSLRFWFPGSRFTECLEATGTIPVGVHTPSSSEPSQQLPSSASIEQTIADKMESQRQTWNTKLADLAVVLPPIDEVAETVLRGIRAARLQ